MQSEFFCRQLDKFTHGITSPARFIRRNHVNRQLINRLGLEKSLQGHQGCVNCLEWDERGIRLASGSDDCYVIIWDPFEHKHVFSMNTGHVGNIFSVKFMPSLNEYILVTGAGDAKIRVHDVSRMETRHVFSCHTSRVKRLANTPSEPFLFWSASEDGTVRQFDLRETNQNMGAKVRNVLVNLNNSGWFAEAKCLAVNSFRPEMLAVGSNDPYVRVYDRRKLTLHAVSSRVRRRLPLDFGEALLHGDSSNDLPLDAARYFVPGHLPSQEVSYRRHFRNVNVTSVSFSPDGDELLANLGGDHIYLFNLNKHQAPFTCSHSTSGAANSNSLQHNGLLFQASRSDRCLRTDWHHSGCRFTSSGERCSADLGALDSTMGCARCTALERSSSQAACLVKAKAFVASVRAYNELIQRWPDEPQLYTGRATALLKRGWNGDVYSALLDCQTTLGLTQRHQTELQSTRSPTRKSLPCSIRDPRSRQCIRLTALLLSTRCLLRLDWVTEARLMLEQARHECPHLTKQSDASNTAASPPPPNGLSNGLRRPTSGSSDEPDAGTNELELDKFFSILSGEIRAKEMDAQRKRHNDAKHHGEQSDADAVKCGSAEVVRDPDVFLKSPSTTAVSHDETEVSNSSAQDISSPNAHPTFSPTQDSMSNSAATCSALPRPDQSSCDSPDTGPGNDPDEFWLPSTYLASSVHSASGGFERTRGGSPPTPLCSCLTCVTTAGKYDNDTESILRPQSSDYTQRYLGHCNAITDIKEANFFGSQGQYIVGGSDCGSLFIWDRHTTNTVRILEADSSTVNCVQPHPSICLLASSGIDSVVRLWSPKPEDDADDPRVIKDHVGAAERNQQRSVSDPLEIMLLNMGYRISELESGFNRLIRDRRRIRRTDRSTGTTRATPRETQRHDRHPLENSSDTDGDFEVRIEWDTALMEQSAEGDDRLSGDAVEEPDPDEDYDNPHDLDDMPVVQGATVFTGEPVPAVPIDSNGVTHQELQPRSESTETSSRTLRNPNNRRGARRGRRGRCQFRRGTLNAAGGDAARGASSRILRSVETKPKQDKRTISSSGFQPAIACSVFDDDDDEIGDEGEGDIDSTDENQIYATSIAPQIDSVSDTPSSTQGTTSSRVSSTSAPFAALHSVLQNGDHLFVYGTTAGSTGRRSSPRTEHRAPETNLTQSENQDDEENAVLEIPCSMS